MNEDEINNTVVQFYKDLYECTGEYDSSNEDDFFRHLDQVASEAETEVVKDITIECFVKLCLTETTQLLVRMVSATRT